VGCGEMILKGFGFVAFFAGVKASSFCTMNIYTGMVIKETGCEGLDGIELA
jgi:hypothetical protein